MGFSISRIANKVTKGAAAVGQIGAAPVVAGFSSVGTGLTAAQPVLAQGTQILQQNPLLGQALSAAAPGLGGIFSGFGAAQGAPVGVGVPASAYPTGQTATSPVLYIAIGAAVLIGAFILLRK